MLRNLDAQEPTESPYLAHILWGMISPNITIRRVEVRTANHPPCTSRSSTIGSASFVMTLPNNNETNTQCLPLCNTPRTFTAFCLSLQVPDLEITWRWTWSCPMKLQIKLASSWWCLRITHAKVKPANKPPRRTSIIERHPLK